MAWQRRCHCYFRKSVWFLSKVNLSINSCNRYDFDQAYQYPLPLDQQVFLMTCLLLLHGYTKPQTTWLTWLTQRISTFREQLGLLTGTMTTSALLWGLISLVLVKFESQFLMQSDKTWSCARNLGSLMYSDNKLAISSCRTRSLTLFFRAKTSLVL